MKPHPISEIFPDIAGKEFDELVEDIRKHGQKQPLEMYQGKILDGRNRWRACQALGIKPKTKDYKGNDPVGHVISLNLTRRHLSESQRAMIADKLSTLGHGGARRSASANLRLETTATKAASALNVSPRSVDNAHKVHEKGTKALQKAVERDEIAVSTAAVLADAPAEIQRAAVKDHGKDAPALAKQVAKDRAEGKPTEPPVKPLGREIPPDVLTRIELEQGMVDEMSGLLVQLARLLTAYEKQILPKGRPENEHKQTKFRDPLDRLSYAIRKSRPASICPFCKLVPEARETCGYCLGAGYVSGAQIDKTAAVPPEYLVEGDDACINVGGKQKLLREVTGEDV